MNRANTIIFSLLILAICSCQYLDKGQKNLKKVKSIEVGMSATDVNLIMASR
jgi:hypothetical protein